jgi:hypothetical protein
MMSKKVSQVVYILFWLWISIQWPDAVHCAEMGPLHVQQRYPLYLMFLTPEPDSPRVIEKGRFMTSLSIDYTSIYIDEASKKWAALLDMEMTVVDLSLTYGITNRVNISLTLPWISQNDGFLDGPLEAYHDFFGFPNYGREDGPVDEFRYNVSVDDDAWFDARSGGLHLGESVVSVKIQLTSAGSHQGLISSLLLALKIPTGDEDHGFGSGRFDQGLVLLNQYRISPLILYFNPGIVLLSDPETQGADIHVNDMMTLLAGIEYNVSDTWSLMGQFNFVTSPFHDTGIAQMDQDSLELVFGFAVSISDDMVFECAFSEDLTRTAPDFTVHGALRYEFGP